MSALLDYIEAYRRIHGKCPRLRQCVEHFDGKLLNVQMSLWELPPEVKSELRRAAVEDRRTRGR